MQSRKMLLMNLFAGNNGDAKNRLMNTGGVGEGEGGTNGESTMETYTLSWVK